MPRSRSRWSAEKQDPEYRRHFVGGEDDEHKHSYRGRRTPATFKLRPQDATAKITIKTATRRRARIAALIGVAPEPTFKGSRCFLTFVEREPFLSRSGELIRDELGGKHLPVPALVPVELALVSLEDAIAHGEAHHNSGRCRINVESVYEASARARAA